MGKVEVLVLIAILLIFGFLFVVADQFYSTRDTKIALCEQAGGIPLMRRDGQFNVCLRADATIELTEK